MRKTALILASALAFDLGIVSVAAQAQQQTPEPPRGPATGTGPTGGRAGGVSGLAAVDPDSPGAATGRGNQLGPGYGGGPACEECTDEPAAISDQAAAGNLTSYLAATPSDGHKHRQDHVFIKLDRVNTVRACLARRGDVVDHEGARQCRLPQAGGAAIGNPTRNLPGGIPPRN